MVKVSVIVPVRNESSEIRRCLDSLLRQDFPKEMYEIIVVDGSSNDGTREVLERYRYDERVRILHNPRQFTPFALNLGLSQARGIYISRVDAHAYVSEDYLKEGVRFLEEHADIDVVGGPLIHNSDGFLATAIALAMTSPFGTGGVLFRSGKREGLVDTLAFGIYRRSVFQKIGNFSEVLLKNQDDEFHFRLTRNGGKIFLTKRIKVYYTPRRSYRNLFKQYLGYGFYRPKVIKMHRRVAALRHLVPPVFVMSLMVLLLLSPFSNKGRSLFFLLLSLYLGLSLLFSLQASRKRGSFRIFPYVLPAFWAMHLGYGLGFLKGLYKAVKR